MAKDYYKRRYSIPEFYGFLKDMMRTIKYLSNAKKKQLITNDFINHIMLSVTEVNGCELCSYVHTADALKNGMSEEDIQLMVSGSFDHMDINEGVALLFAQHYAEKKGKPSKESWERLIEIYGKEKALGILAATRMIMMGNTHGIAAGALKNRIQNKPIPKSNFGYEIGLTLAILPFLPISIVDGLIANLRKQPLITFS